MIFVETEKFIDFLVKHKMSPNQFMFCYLKAAYDMNSFRKYIKGVGKWKKEEIQDLLDRGYLEDFNATNPNGTKQEFIDSYLTTPKFFKELFVETEQAGEELWNTFPTHIMINGNRVSARSCDKTMICKEYPKRIKNSIKKHEEIIELLKEAISRNEIRMGIEKWVLSEQWLTLKELYKNNNSTTTYGETEFS